MPRYDYRCTGCSEEFELVQSFSEAGTGTCPLCSGAGQRVFHAVPVIYKGSGFYTTDYGRPKPPAENNSDGKAAKDSSKSASDGAKSGTETKASSGDGATSNGTSSDSSAKSTSEAASSKS